MAWFKVDDKFHSHRKVKSIPRQHRPAAVGLWLMAGSWVAGETQDGVVPDYMIREFGATVSDAKRLETAGLWERNETDSAWFFHDWHEYQFTKEQILSRNHTNAEKQKRYRQRKQGDVTGDVTGNAVGNTEERYAPPSLPVPTQPVLPTEELTPPSPTVRGRAKSPKTKLPPDWTPTPELEAAVRDRCPGILKASCDLSTRKFVDHYVNGRGNRETRVHWDETWLNWIETDFQRLPRTGGGVAGPTPFRNRATERNDDSRATIARLEAMAAATAHPHQHAIGT